MGLLFGCSWFLWLVCSLVVLTSWFVLWVGSLVGCSIAYFVVLCCLIVCFWFVVRFVG